VGEILDGRYRLESVIARGGMGVVMSATHLQLERTVAIKFLHAHLAGDDTLWKRFQREVSISKELNHTNIVRIFDFGESESGYMFLVMEYLEGEELKTMMVREGPQSTTRVLAIAEQVLDGLAEAHSAEVIHRDLKPGNIYMTTDRRGRDVPKILDFGIAKSLQSAQQQLTSVGSITGTPGYLSPESFVHGDGGKPADIYAVGLIFAEMLLGQRVVEAPTAGQAMIKHLQMPLILPPRLAETGLGQVLLRAVQKDPTQRFADADEMLTALQAQNSTPEFTLSAQEVNDSVGAMLASLPDMSSPKLMQAAVDSATSSPNLSETKTEFMLDTNSLLNITQVPVAEPAKPAGVPVWGVVAVAIVALALGGLVVFLQGDSPPVIPPATEDILAQPVVADTVVAAEPGVVKPVEVVEIVEPEEAEAIVFEEAPAIDEVEEVEEIKAVDSKEVVEKPAVAQKTVKSKPKDSAKKPKDEEKKNEVDNLLDAYLK